RVDLRHRHLIGQVVQVLPRQLREPGLLRVRPRHVTRAFRLDDHPRGAIRIARDLAADQNVVTPVLERYRLLDLPVRATGVDRWGAEVVVLPSGAQQDDAEAVIVRDRVGHHLPVAWLEDVQRKPRPREEHEVRQREEWKQKLAFRPAAHFFLAFPFAGATISNWRSAAGFPPQYPIT